MPGARGDPNPAPMKATAGGAQGPCSCLCGDTVALPRSTMAGSRWGARAPTTTGCSEGRSSMA
eukprot:255718-Alexandrium_andersonii.AAC.1